MNAFTIRFFTMAFICCLFFTHSDAQSLLSNGTFDNNITGWSNPNLNPTWIANDGANASGNGSIEFGDNFNNGSSINVDSELVPVVEGYRYILASSYKYQTGSIPNGMSVAIEWYDSQGNFVGEYPWNVSFDMSQPDQWLNFDTAVNNIIEDATQARVRLWIHQRSSGTDFNTGRFDDVILFQDTVFMSNFD